MIVARLPTTVCIRQESRGSRAANLLFLYFSPFAHFSSWEPGHEQTD
jgi:hypothetical protein